MKRKMLLVGMLIGSVSLLLFWWTMSFSGSGTSSAQTSDTEYQKLLERDRNVSKEKVEKAFAEAKKIQDNILAIISENKPQFKLRRAIAGHLSSGNGLEYSTNPGGLGVTRNELSWETNKTRPNKTWLSMNISLELNKESALKLRHHGLRSISMGDFFDVPNIGDEATLVKNVTYNTRNTQVGLHFVKGRAQVSIYLINHQRKTEQNEKELFEIMRLIEPLIVAGPDFDNL